MTLVRSQLSSRLRAAAWTSWLLALLLALGVFIAPALVASSVTAAEQPVSFLQEPWRGWTFLGGVVTGAATATAPSPGAALRLAQRQFTSPDDARATRARLAWVPSGHALDFTVLAADGLHSEQITPRRPLVWLIDGRRDGRGGVVAVVDYDSGELAYDVRDRDASARLDELPTSDAVVRAISVPSRTAPHRTAPRQEGTA